MEALDQPVAAGFASKMAREDEMGGPGRSESGGGGAVAVRPA